MENRREGGEMGGNGKVGRKVESPRKKEREEEGQIKRTDDGGNEGGTGRTADERRGEGGGGRDGIQRQAEL